MSFDRYYPVRCFDCGKVISQYVHQYEQLLKHKSEVISFESVLQESQSYLEAFEKIWGPNFALGYFLGSMLDRGLEFDQALTEAMTINVPFAADLYKYIIDGHSLDESLHHVGKVSRILDTLGLKRTCCRYNITNPTLLPVGHTVNDLTQQMQNLTFQKENYVSSQGVLDMMKPRQPSSLQQTNAPTLTNAKVTLSSEIPQGMQPLAQQSQPAQRRVIRKYYAR